MARVRGETENAPAAVHDRDHGVEHQLPHVRSGNENALPLIMTHGWPARSSSCLEYVGPLTAPTAHGGTATRTHSTSCCHRLTGLRPSLASPPKLRWERRPHSEGVGGADAPHRLYRYVAQGGDVGCLRHRPDGAAPRTTEGASASTRTWRTGLAGGTHPAESEEGAQASRRPPARSGRAASDYFLPSRPRARRRWLSAASLNDARRPGCSTTTRDALLQDRRRLRRGPALGRL